MNDPTTLLDLPPVIAHRGLSARAPENTLSAVRAAHADGCRWVELDVQLLADGTPVIWHDAGVRRCSDGRGKLRHLDRARSLQLDVGTWFGEAFRGERMATLQDMLTLLAELDMGLNLELKVNRGRDAAALVAGVLPPALGTLSPSRLLVSSFSISALNACRRYEADPARLALGLLYKQIPRSWAAEAERLSAYSVHADWRRLRPIRAKAVIASPYRLVCYTVNAPSVYRQLRAWGVDSVISDDPLQLAG
ncbi:MAG: glycerophosphodiester phosphodiesterase family protein [Halomonas sp.]|nr:glycerophosphodiester phosphodiesterase family protein [Halomonas sp.]